jgi:putative transposase
VGGVSPSTGPDHAGLRLLYGRHGAPSAPLPAPLHRDRQPAGPPLGVTANPIESWVTQQARNLSFALAGRSRAAEFPIRDRDTKFTASFDEVFRTEGIRIIKTPVRAPRANAFAEWFVGTVRRECLDRLLIFGRRHLEQVLTEYLAHYNLHRPHRALDQRAPQNPGLAPDPVEDPDPVRLRRTDVLGNLIHEYRLVA